MAKSEMTEEQLVVMLQAEERAAVAYQNTEVAQQQEEALKYYDGDGFGNEEEGRSQVVSRDVSSTIDSLMPDLIAMFVSGDEVVEFEPERPGDEAFVKQATNYINHQFFKDNDGFNITHDWAKDGAISKVGIVKIAWDSSDRKKREVKIGLSEDQLVMIGQDDTIKIVEHEKENGAHNVTVIRTVPHGRILIQNIPPEEFLVAKKTRLLADAHYCAHKSLKTVSDLVEMGFEYDEVVEMASHDENSIEDTRIQGRYEDENIGTDTEDKSDPAMRSLWVVEEYVKTDYDGDGIAECRKIIRVNRTVLENIEVDEHPFIDFCPNRMPHKMYGKSSADDTMDIQKIKSTLLRQAMDNLYQSNNPRQELVESGITEDTIDDLLTVRPGAPIRVKQVGTLREISLPFTAAHSFSALEYWDGEKEQRTGVTRYNQGMDPDTLNKTATGIDLIMKKGMGKILLIARNLANAFGMLFRKMLRMTVAYQDNIRIVWHQGEWVEFDPRGWNADMGVNIKVGLGTGDKTDRLQARMTLLGLQREALAEGLTTPQHVYNNIEGIVKDMDLGEASKYFPKPDEMPPPEQPDQDPAMAQAMQELQMKMQIEQKKLELQMMTERMKIESQAQLKREQMQAEIQLKQQEMMLEAQMGSHSIDNVDLGGDIG